MSRRRRRRIRRPQWADLVSHPRCVPVTRGCRAGEHAQSTGEWNLFSNNACKIWQLKWLSEKKQQRLKSKIKSSWDFILRCSGSKIMESFVYNRLNRKLMIQVGEGCWICLSSSWKCIDERLRCESLCWYDNRMQSIIKMRDAAQSVQY